MELEEYLGYIRKYEIPPRPPDYTMFNTPSNLGDHATEQISARNECNSYGLWTVIADTWVKQLADWMEGNVLEIMAGAGWLAKGLENHGVKIWATDDGSWDARHSKMQPLTHIAKVGAYDAVVESPDADILLVSWPPYGKPDVVKACRAWSAQGPIVYIGEGHGGCNAPDEFFEHFMVNDDAPEIDIPQWWGLHDILLIGEWRKDK